MIEEKKIRYNEIYFDDVQKREIADLYLSGLSAPQIGKRFECSHKKIAKILDEFDIPRTGASHRKYELSENYFDVIDSANKAYILGFLYADGCNVKSRSTISISLQEDDVDILEKIRLEIGYSKALQYIDYTNKHDFGYTYKNQYRLTLFSKHMSDALDDLGVVPNKSLRLKYPKFLRDDLHSHFIRGYFDGDGSFYTYKSNYNVSITSTNDFCLEMKRILNNSVKINCSISDAQNKNGITKILNISGKNQVLKYRDYIYDDADLFLKRKFDKFNLYYTN